MYTIKLVYEKSDYKCNKCSMFIISFPKNVIKAYICANYMLSTTYCIRTIRHQSSILWGRCFQKIQLLCTLLTINSKYLEFLLTTYTRIIIFLFLFLFLFFANLHDQHDLTNDKTKSSSHYQSKCQNAMSSASRAFDIRVSSHFTMNRNKA